MICGNKIARFPPPSPPPPRLLFCFFCFFFCFHLNAVWRAIGSALGRIPERTGWAGVKGNFDVVIENDDLDRAVGELSGYLREWFPKIEAAEHISAADGGDEKQR